MVGTVVTGDVFFQICDDLVNDFLRDYDPSIDSRHGAEVLPPGVPLDDLG
jgi:hypothetical protein